MGNSVMYGSANNCDGAMFQSLGHNISQGTCTALNAPSDQNAFAGNLELGRVGVQRRRLPDADRAAGAGSPVIDVGDNALCSAADQRGAPRVGTCDIGAVEAGATLPWAFLPRVAR